VAQLLLKKEVIFKEDLESILGKRSEEPTKRTFNTTITTSKQLGVV
jgi:hypothetical protein